VANLKKAWGASHRHLAFIEEILLLFKDKHHKKIAVWSAQCAECKYMIGAPQKVWGASHRHLAFIEEILLLFKDKHLKKTVAWNAR